MNDKVEFVHYNDMFGPLIMKATTWPEEVYDRAHSNLMFYYTQILDEAESKYHDIVSDGGMNPR